MDLSLVGKKYPIFIYEVGSEKIIEYAKATLSKNPYSLNRSFAKTTQYKKLIASTNFEYCPTMRGLKKLKISANSGCVLEIVIDGLSIKDIEVAMRVGIKSILDLKDKKIFSISAGNYGGNLGPFLFRLKEIMR